MPSAGLEVRGERSPLWDRLWCSLGSLWLWEPSLSPPQVSQLHPDLRQLKDTRRDKEPGVQILARTHHLLSLHLSSSSCQCWGLNEATGERETPTC